MIQTFYNYVAKFLTDIDAKDVVEIGSDYTLKLARALSPHCERFYSVNFQKDNERMQSVYGWTRRTMMGNIELLSGNAVRLPDLIDRADVIILQNVLIDGTGRDIDLMWKYIRKEKPCSDDDWRRLRKRFNRAEETAYRGFLRVANPGQIIRFEMLEEDERFKSMLVNDLGVKPKRIKKRKLLYDDTRDVWEAYFIDNS